jgi:hypothetical protein
MLIINQDMIEDFMDRSKMPREGIVDFLSCMDDDFIREDMVASCMAFYDLYNEDGEPSDAITIQLYQERIPLGSELASLLVSLKKAVKAQSKMALLEEGSDIADDDINCEQYLVANGFDSATGVNENE